MSRFPQSSWPNIAVLLGCDYVARVPGVGAFTLFKKILPPCFKDDNNDEFPDFNSDCSRLTEDLLRRLKDVSKKVPIDYDEQYQKAVNLFRYCPILDANAILSPLNPLPKNTPW